MVERTLSEGAVLRWLEQVDLSAVSLQTILNRPVERSEDKWGLRSEPGQYIARVKHTIVIMPDGREVVQEGRISLEEISEMLRGRR